MSRSHTVSTQKVADITGATIRQLNHWVAMQYVAPARVPGYGGMIEWSSKDIEIVTSMVRLISAGFTVQRAAKLARLMTDNPTDKDGHRIKIGQNLTLVVK